jgi:hypothetical protein
MFRSARLNTAVVRLAALAVVLALACPRAEAVLKPFKIKGGGEAPFGIPLPGAEPEPHWAVGEATHLGRYQGLGAVQTDTNNLVIHDDGTITGEFGSAVPFVFTGADGDKLACHYGRTAFGAQHPGTFTLVPQGDGTYVAFWVAEFVPVVAQCTGKFQGIGGSWIMYAMSEPFVLGADDPVAYVWQGEGQLDFKQGK